MLTAISLFSCSDNDKFVLFNIEQTREVVRLQCLTVEIFEEIDLLAKKRIPLNPDFQDTTNSIKCLIDSISPVIGNTFPKTVYMDYGTINCKGDEGLNRRGQMIATFDRPYTDPGCVVDIIFNEFYIDELRVDGVLQLINNGQNSNNQVTYSFNSVSLQYTDENTTSSHSFNPQLTISQIEGADTKEDQSDEKFAFSGICNGVAADGSSFDIEVNQTLLLISKCRWFVSGTANVNSSDGSFTVDFGDGSCDNLILLSNKENDNYNTVIP